MSLIDPQPTTDSRTKQQNFLLSFGFVRTVTASGHHYFRHPHSEAEVILQALPRERVAHPFHWTLVRGTLDDFNILPREKFFDAVQDRRRAVS